MTKEEALGILMRTWVTMPAGEERVKFKDAINCFDDGTPEENYKESIVYLEGLKNPKLTEAIQTMKANFKEYL